MGFTGVGTRHWEQVLDLIISAFPDSLLVMTTGFMSQAVFQLYVADVTELQTNIAPHGESTSCSPHLS